MTTESIIATLKQGVPVTSRLVREIIVKLERLDWAERSLRAALEKYGSEAGDVKLSAEEASWVCDGLDAHKALRGAVEWLLDVDEAQKWVMAECPWTTDDSWDEITESAAFARELVRRIM